VQTVTLSVRVPRAEAARLTRAAQAVGMERGALMKEALREGCADVLADRSCAMYRRGQITLSRAAELAGVSLRDLLLRMSRAGVELQYDTQELDKDLAP
jgi:predicted HTH domain antitoxin